MSTWLGCPGSLRRTALAWIAIQGDLATHLHLLARLRERPDADLLWAAGVTGRIDAAVLALELLEGRFGEDETVRVDARDGELVFERAAELTAAT